MTIKNLLALKKIWFVCALSWTVLIFYLCLVDSSELPSLAISGNYFDKVIHFTFHFVFTLLWVFYIYLPSKKIGEIEIVKVISAAIVFGIVIEILQGCYTTTRNADLLDIIANTFGALLAGALLYIIFRRNKLKTN